MFWVSLPMLHHNVDHTAPSQAPCSSTPPARLQQVAVPCPPSRMGPSRRQSAGRTASRPPGA